MIYGRLGCGTCASCAQRQQVAGLGRLGSVEMGTSTKVAIGAGVMLALFGAVYLIMQNDERSRRRYTPRYARR